jgi:hypothetical protein
MNRFLSSWRADVIHQKLLRQRGQIVVTLVWLRSSFGA